MPTPRDPSRSRRAFGFTHEPVVDDQDVGAGLGRPDRPRRHRFAPARPDRGPPEEEESGGDAGQGVSEGPRYYDYGPGRQLRRDRQLFSRNNRPFAVLFYEGRHLYSLDGVRANHFLQRGRIDLLLPLRGALGLGVTGEYFDRRTFYQDADRTARAATTTRRCAPTSRGGCREPSRCGAWVRGLCLLALAPALAFAQAAPGTPPTPAGAASSLWLVAGGAFATLRGDCQTCEEDYPYRHAGARAGRYRISRQRSHGRRRRSLLDADRHRAGQHPHDAPRRRGAVQALGLAGVLPERRRRDGVRPELGGRPRSGLVQREGAVRGHRRRMGLSAGRSSACRCSARSTPALGDLQASTGTIPDVHRQPLVDGRRDRHSLTFVVLARPASRVYHGASFFIPSTCAFTTTARYPARRLVPGSPRQGPRRLRH